MGKPHIHSKTKREAVFCQRCFSNRRCSSHTLLGHGNKSSLLDKRANQVQMEKDDVWPRGSTSVCTSNDSLSSPKSEFIIACTLAKWGPNAVFHGSLIHFLIYLSKISNLLGSNVSTIHKRLQNQCKHGCCSIGTSSCSWKQKYASNLGSYKIQFQQYTVQHIPLH